MIRILTLAIVALFGLVGQSLAQPLKLVSGPDYAPFVDSEKPDGGFSTRIVTEALHLAGYETDVTWRPWKRAYDGVVKGRFDLTFPYVWTRERAEQVRYSEPLLNVRQTAWFSADREQLPTSIDELAGMTMCLPLGWAPAHSLSPLLEAGRLHRVSPQTKEQCLQMVTLKRADFLTANNFGGPTLFRRTGTEGRFKSTDFALASNDLFVIVGRENPNGAGYIEAFNRGLGGLRRSGRFDEIVRSVTHPGY